MATHIDILDESWGGDDCFVAACEVVSQRLRRPADHLIRLLGRHPLSLGIRSHKELAAAGERHGGLAMRLREHLRQRESVGALVRCGADDGDICLIADVVIGYRGDDEQIYFAEPWGLGVYRGRPPRFWWKFADRDPDERDEVVVDVSADEAGGDVATDGEGTDGEGTDKATDKAGADDTDADTGADDTDADTDTGADAGSGRRRWWQRGG